MDYCANDQPFGTVWLKGAFNPCFIDTLAAVVVALIIGVCAIIELRIYIRHGTALDKELLGPPPLLYVIQMVLSGFIFAMQPLRLLMRSIDGTIYGHMVLKDAVLSVVWLMSSLLVYVERNYDLPTQPRRGHSIYLIIFWGMALAVDSVYFVNLQGEHWYFQLRTGLDGVMLALFLAQWIAELLIFGLGIRAPGMISSKQRNQYIYRPMSESPPKYGALMSVDDSTMDQTSLEATVECVQAIKEGLVSGRLLAEFQSLSRQSSHATIAVAKLRENETLNRYWNILPYDYNRLIVGVDGYINASWISMQFDEGDVERRYIASQGPTPETITDFWQMVWEQQVPVIVMLTDLIENAMRKCEQYWPASGDSLELDNMVVSCSHVEQPRGRGWTLREFFLLRLHDREQRTVTQLQFHGWPDHGALKDSRKLIDFWRTARALLPERHIGTDGTVFAPPMLVHCSAGVGRTGAYILMETLILAFESGSPIDPIQVVKLMRDQRMATVQTDDQFVFACKAALAYYDTIRK